MLKKLIDILSNPILYYPDKEGNAVFRNFCWFENTGNKYNFKLEKAQVGKILEYRFGLEKYLKLAYFLTPIIIYFIFIHMKFSLWNLLVCEFWGLAIVCLAQGICSYMYSNFLLGSFGKYELVEFQPHLPKQKTDEFKSLFYSKVTVFLIILGIFFLPAFALQGLMKWDISSKRRFFKNAIGVSKIYLTFYPKTENIYDMSAYAKYMKRDYKGALKDYKTVLGMSGSRFTKRDYTRFANLLLLERKLGGAETAVDVFNDYVTRKKMSILEQSQMLWIKSIFRVENHITESIMADYDDMINSLDKKDYKNKFYITSDEAYILYIMQDYTDALNYYNALILCAEGNKKEYSKELQSLYAERAITSTNLGDIKGSDADFMTSNIDTMKIDSYEPSYNPQEFVVEKF